MDNHQEEFDCFEEEMNRKDTTGYQMIMSQAMALVSEYEKHIKRKIDKGTYNDVSDIETLLIDNDIAQLLMNDINHSDKESIVPCMFSWLFFGKSFERMIEKGEELKNSPEIPEHEKQLIAYTIKMLISASVKLGLRTEGDWTNYNNLKKAIANDQIIDWAINQGIVPEPEKKKPGRRKVQKTFPQLLTIHVSDKDTFMDKVEEYMVSKNTSSDLAYLKVALEEMYYLNACDITTFREALCEYFEGKIAIVGERVIQGAYKRLNEYVPASKKHVKDIGKDRRAIDEVIEFLSD